MASLRGAVICPVVRAKQTGVHSVPVDFPLLKTELVRSRFGGLKGVTGRRMSVGYERKCPTIRGCFSSSSNGNGSMAGNSRENDADYVNSSVVEAVEVRSGSDGFMIKMRDGRYVRCVHNNHQGGHLPDYAPQPAIVLKMEDESGLLLPIIVLEMPSVLLMAAVRNVQIARPTMYQVVKDMIEKMGYRAKHVRVTKRVHEAYFAELHLAKLENEEEILSFDLRPSDAINIAVRCKVPIQVNRFLAYNDGMRVVESAKESVLSTPSDGLFFTELDSCQYSAITVWISSWPLLPRCDVSAHFSCSGDTTLHGQRRQVLFLRRPTGQLCIETKEFNLMQNMLIAAVEERYNDAALWRDKLTQLRSKKNWT